MSVAEIKSEPGAKIVFLDMIAAKQTVRSVKKVFGSGAKIQIRNKKL